MNRRLVLGAIVTLAWVAASGPIGAQTPQATFRAGANVVSVNVSVMKGRDPVTGLTAADFELTDAGVRQTVEATSLEHVPLDLTLVLTGYASDRAADHLRGLGSAEATRKLLLPADRLRIVHVNDDVSGGLVGPGYSVPTDHFADDRIGGIALIDGLFYALAWPVDPDRRHLVVAFTDGSDTWSTLELETLPKLAAHSDAVLHAVLWASPVDGPGSNGAIMWYPPSAGARQWQASYRVVDDTVRRTGGTLQTASRAPEALASIIADYRSSYVLRYTPRGVAPAGWHDLQVRVARPGSFTIRSRKGYEGD